MSIQLVNKMITEHFDYDEEWIRCKCCDALKITDRFFQHMEKLEGMRVELDFGLKVTSGYRCPKHNREVGGADESQHLIFATDLEPILHEGEEHLLHARVALISAMAPDYDFTGIGTGTGFVHIDMRHTQASRPVIRWTYPIK